MGTAGKRGLITAAVTVVCAITVLAAPGTAFASPASPTPTPTTAPAPTPAPSGTASAAPALPPNKDLEAVRAKLEKLYHDAAVATEAYNAAEEASKKQSEQLVALAEKIVEGQRRLDALKDRAGAAARQQYRSGGLPPEAHLVLSDDPGQFLDGAGRVIQGERATKAMLDEMTRTQQDLKQYAADAAAHWRELETNRKKKEAAREKVKKQISEAEKLESRLEKEEKERLAELERQAAQKAQTAWLDTGILKEIQATASEQGAKAVTYATAQTGKPYEWGAEGPQTFDCSGLTMQAWAHAGRAIPRTSQEQWRQLRHVDVKDMRPGDLVVYFADASHVGMYIGDGSIVHAPRPGRTVTVAGAGSMPILGVVRPDA
ncbi:NlpC/P60 family protein [Streptomyces sp. NPDC057386]|uniref:C40 family peptidase n=1 Tax=unclassified Streptomyces TaxID=2593676 RepID=UPI00362E147C